MTTNKVNFSKQLIIISTLGTLCSLWHFLVTSIYIPILALPFIIALAYAIDSRNTSLPSAIILVTSVIYLYLTSESFIHFYKNMDEAESFFVFALPFLIVLTFIPLTTYILTKKYNWSPMILKLAIMCSILTIILLKIYSSE